MKTKMRYVFGAEKANRNTEEETARQDNIKVDLKKVGCEDDDWNCIQFVSNAASSLPLCKAHITVPANRS